MNKLTLKEVFNIPNILSYIRILLIPVFVVIFLQAETVTDYYWAAGIVAFSALTDFVDGYIAIRFNQITDLGKLIDPVADKLTQLALVICMCMKYKLIWSVIVIFLAKDGFMAIMGFYLLKKYNRKLDGAKWYGKVCTAVFYLVMVILLVFPTISLWLANSLILLCAGMMGMAFVLYIPDFLGLLKQK